ncbi:MAG: gluconate 2-dehydrogenase subunit 3 family protein [Gemmatimonadaceae bacterium]
MSTLAPVRAHFRAIAATIVADAAALDAAGWRDVEAIIDEALEARPAAVRRQLRAFIRALAILPVLRYGRTFASLDPARRARVLGAVESAPALLLRRGFWGLRTLVYMGYYARPAGAAAIGYRASLRGWHDRRSAP